MSSVTLTYSWLFKVCYKHKFFVQLAYPHTAHRQRDRADEHAVQGEVPQGHPADGGATQQLHQRS